MTRRSTRTLIALAAAVVAGVVVTSCGPSGPKVTLVGDSITDVSREEFEGSLGDAYDLEIVGRFGKRADEVEPEIEAVAAATPSAVVINLGTNDVLQEVPTEQAAESIDRMVGALDAADCVLVVTINESMSVDGTSFTEGAEALNERIEEIVDAHANAGVLDWNEVIEDNGGNDEVTWDTYHPSDAGRVVLADAYRDAIDSC